MWSDLLRLVLPERGDEGKADEQPAHQDTNPPPEHKNPESSDTETLKTPTPKKLIAEEAEKMPTPGEHVLVYFPSARLFPARSIGTP